MSSATALMTFNELEGRDRFLVRQVTLLGFKAFVEEMSAFSRDCGQSYGDLDEAGLFREAEQMRIWTFCWAVRVKEATGRLEFPRLVKSSKRAAWIGNLGNAIAHGASFLPKSAEQLKKRLGEPELALFYDLRNRRLFDFLTENSSLSVYISTAPTKDNWLLVWQFMAGRHADFLEPRGHNLRLEFKSCSQALEVRIEDLKCLDSALTGIGNSGWARQSDLLPKTKRSLHHIMSIDFHAEKLIVTENLEQRKWSDYGGSYVDIDVASGLVKDWWSEFVGLVQ